MFAILSVVVQHATNEAPKLHPETGPMPFTWSYLVGANTMLLVSAYFVCVTLRGRPSARWWWNRVARLVPPYLVAVVVTYLLVLAFAPAGWFVPDLHDMVGNLLLLESFATDSGPGSVHFVDPSYWTLTAQLAAFTVAALLVRRIRWSRPCALPTLCWLLVAAPLVLRQWRADSVPLRVFFDGVSVDRWQLFAMGIGIWLWSRRRMAAEDLALLLSVGVFVEYHEDVHSGIDTAWGSAIGLGLIALAMVATAARPGWATVLARPIGRPVAWLAGISYGVYLLNQELGYLVSSALRTHGVNAWLCIAAVVGAAVLLGWLLTRWVERPAHRMLAELPARITLGPVLDALRVRVCGWALVLRLEWAVRTRTGAEPVPGQVTEPALVRPSTVRA